MRTLVLIFTSFAFAVSVNAQTVTQAEKRTFKNQGEQEDYWAEKLFAEKYKEEKFDKFNGEIVVLSENMIKYDDEILIINNTDRKLKAIFEKGIFYPEIITGPLLKGIARKQDLESMVIKNDSLRISNFQELNFLSKSPKIKRFKFWLFSKGFANPTAYFIELTNTKATIETDIETFIEGAKLTFAKKGWIGI